MTRLLAAIFGRPEPPPLPVFTAEPSPPYRACKPCGVSWRGYDDCWSPTHQPPQPSQPEES